MKKAARPYRSGACRAALPLSLIHIFAAAGYAEDKGITVQKLFAVGNNHILADNILPVVDTVLAFMPGFTHLQKAQPVTLAHHVGAYFEMFSRDRGRLHDILSLIHI